MGRAVRFSGLVCLAVMLLAYPARGEFLRVYLSGKPPGRVAAEDREVLKAVWLGPSVGFDAFIYNLDTKTARVGIIPGVGYGIKWKPAWWRVTSNLLAVDLFISASLTNDIDAHEGFDHISIDLVPVVTAFDWVSIGLGASFLLGLEDQASTTQGLLTFGVRKAI